MKIFITFILSALLYSFAGAQTYKPFKLALTAGYAFPAGEYVKGGITSWADLQYALNDNVTLGIGGGSFNIGPSSVPIITGNEIFLGHADLICATGSYYFNTNSVRPFLNLATGLGIVDTYDATIALDPTKVNKLAIMPGLGIDGHHVRLIANYVFLGKAAGMASNFAEIRVGFFLGGKKK